MIDSVTTAQPSTYSEKKKLWSQEYYRKNKEKILKRNAAWWKAHPEQRREKERRRYVRCRDKRKESCRRSRLKNIEKRRLANSEWQRKNWEYRRQYVKRYYRANRDRLLHVTKEWCKANPDKVIEKDARRRQRTKDATKNPQTIRKFVLGVKSKKQVTCYYCGQKTSTVGVHFDHIVPICKGGAHSVENLCVACPSCNLSKHTSLINDWRIDGQQIMNL